MIPYGVKMSMKPLGRIQGSPSVARRQLPRRGADPSACLRCRGKPVEVDPDELELVEAGFASFRDELDVRVRAKRLATTSRRTRLAQRSTRLS